LKDIIAELNKLKMNSNNKIVAMSISDLTYIKIIGCVI